MTGRRCLIVLALVSAVSTGRAGDREQMDRLCAANSAAVAAIRTVHFRVRYTQSDWNITGGEYWRSGESVRMHFVHKGSLNQVAIRDGVVKNQLKQDIRDSPSIRDHARKSGGLDGDHYWHGGIETPKPGRSNFLLESWHETLCVVQMDGRYMPLAEFAETHRRNLRAVRQGEAGGVPTEVIEFRFDQYTRAFHLDPAARHMIRKVVYGNGDKPADVSVEEVTGFRPFPGGAFFPTGYVSNSAAAGEPHVSKAAEFTDIAVNKPIPESLFAFKFRHGITVTDRIQGKKYRVNENGVPLGEKTDMPVFRPGPPETAERATLPHAATAADAGEPGRFGWWVLPASLVALAASLGLLLLRRRRRAETD